MITFLDSSYSVWIPVTLNLRGSWETFVFEFQDRRVSLGAEERLAECDLCGAHLVLLPNDKRGCRCFDCLRVEAFATDQD